MSRFSLVQAIGMAIAKRTACSHFLLLPSRLAPFSPASSGPVRTRRPAKLRHSPSRRRFHRRDAGRFFTKGGVRVGCAPAWQSPKTRSGSRSKPSGIPGSAAILCRSGWSKKSRSTTARSRCNSTVATNDACGSARHQSRRGGRAATAGGRHAGEGSDRYPCAAGWCRCGRDRGDEDRRHQARHRGRQRQRRRRQIDRGRQSRGRPRANWRAGGAVRLRHLRAEHRAHVRHARPADGHGREQDHPDRAIRSEADVDGLPARRHRAGHSARPDGDALHAAVSPAGGVGRTRLSRFSISRPAPGTFS